jgi:hypothetical protein
MSTQNAQPLIWLARIFTSSLTVDGRAEALMSLLAVMSAVS